MAKNQGKEDGLKHRIKSFLGLKKSKAIPTSVYDDKEAENYIFSQDVLKELNKENSFNHRSRVLRELCEVVMTRRLEEHAVEAVWCEIEDLLQPSVPTEPRQTSLKFLTCLALGQRDKLGLLKAQFLRFIENHDVKEDLSLRIELLRVITDNGKDVSYCEHIGPFLLVFTTQAFSGDRPDDFLQLLINFMHYNSSFLDKEVITSLVKQTCEFCNRAKDEKEIESCLQLLDAAVKYGGLPSGGLYPLIVTLCQTVNIERFCQASWKLMKALVGTRLGHSSIYIMCCILEDENNRNESVLLRGAVFFIGMCVWGSKRVASLQHKPISLLPSFKQALHCNHPIVAHEIGLSLQRLVKKYGKDLKIVTWDIIFDLIDMLVKLQQTLASASDSLKGTVHDLLTNIEELYTADKFDGEAVRLFTIIERCSSQRPEASVLTLLSYLNEQIHPAKDGWLDRIKFVMEKYFRKEPRTNVRVKVLDMLSAIMSSFRFWYEEELIEFVVLPYLNNSDAESDVNVRSVTAQLLIDLIDVCSSTRCMDILNIINKLITRPLAGNEAGKSTGDDKILDNELQLRDIKIAVSGLIASFKRKLFESPPSMAVGILAILVDHVCNHYVHGFMSETGSTVRYEVFKLFLSIRADSLHRVGVLQQVSEEGESQAVTYSVFLSCKTRKFQEQSKFQDQPASSMSTPHRRRLSLTKECPLNKTFDAILNCLKDEWDWTVLEYVLKNLPDQLQNKTLILGSSSDVTNLCALLCKMVNDGMYLNKVKNVPSGSGKSELHNLVFPILAVLVTYHDAIEKPRQIELVKSLELGLNSQCSRLCVIYLTICILEMKSIMLKILPSILLKLSKISATVHMSIPMLEFLSSLKEIKPLYSNFVEEQYMSIFAIALPYTDAYRYPSYTVTLAHYVIAAWFTRCRLSFRKGFVRLITKGLQSSALSKTSLTQTGKKPLSKVGSVNDENQEFHTDMTTICSDMMAKYSFSSLSNQPKRSPVVEFLLSNGLSQSWLVGNTLVTVTTSSASSDDCPTCAAKRKRTAAERAAKKLRRLHQVENVDTTPSTRNINTSKQTLYSEQFGGIEQSDRGTTKVMPHPDASIKKPTVEMAIDAALNNDDCKLDNTKNLKDAMSPGNIAKPMVGNVKSVVPQIESSLREKDDQSLTSDTAVKPQGPELSRNLPPMIERGISDIAGFGPTAATCTASETGTTLTTGATARTGANAIGTVYEEVSLVNKLALEQQRLGAGKMFSPSDYLTASIESDSIFYDQTDETEATKSTGLKSSLSLEKETLSQPIEDQTMENGGTTKRADEGRGSNEVDASLSTSNMSSYVKLGEQDHQYSPTSTKAAAEMCTDEERGNIDEGQEMPNEEYQRAPAWPQQTDANRDLLLQKSAIPSHLVSEQRFADTTDSNLVVSDVQSRPASIAPSSQNSSAQVTPIMTRRAPFQSPVEGSLIEPSSVFEMVDSSNAGDVNTMKTMPTTNPLTSDTTSFPLCNCSCEGWAEILIRRPTGNTSWVMKIENAVAMEGDFGNFNDVTSLAASFESDDYKSNVGHYFEPVTHEEHVPRRPRFLSVIGDESSRERHSTRSSSGSSKTHSMRSQDSNSASPSTLPRRRFSTGSLDYPCDFWLSLPSPASVPRPSFVKGKAYFEETPKNSWQFEKPSLGFSPISSLKRQSSFNCTADIKDKHAISTEEPETWRTIQHENNRLHQRQERVPEDKETNIERPLPSRPKKALTKSVSSPLKIEKVSSSHPQRLSSIDNQLMQIPMGTRDVDATAKRDLFTKQMQHNKDDAMDSKSVLTMPKSFIRPPAGTLTSEQPVVAPTTALATAATASRKDTGATAVGAAESRDEDRSDAVQRHQRLERRDTVAKSKFESQHKTGAQIFKDKLSSFRPRGQTFSVYPVSKKTANEKLAPGSENWLKSSLNPYYVFLQFFYSPFMSNWEVERPLLLGSGEMIDRSIKMLDRIPPYDHHKIGILYVGTDQESNETAILANVYGSSRYVEFLSGLGDLICLPDCCPTEIYTGGLDRNGADGKFAYSWRDDITQVLSKTTAVFVLISVGKHLAKRLPRRQYKS
eukprot:gene8869-9818_t